MMVMMMAITPSLNASSRPFPMGRRSTRVAARRSVAWTPAAHGPPDRCARESRIDFSARTRGVPGMHELLRCLRASPPSSPAIAATLRRRCVRTWHCRYRWAWWTCPGRPPRIVRRLLRRAALYALVRQRGSVGGTHHAACGHDGVTGSTGRRPRDPGDARRLARGPGCRCHWSVHRDGLSAGYEGDHRGNHRGRQAVERLPRAVREYVTHMRDEADHVIEALEETFHIGRELGVPVIVSHHKVQNRPNFGRSAQTLSLIGRTMKHQCVSLD